MKTEGLVLESKYAEFQFCIKGPIRKVWRDGFPVDESQIITLQFDRYLCELDDMARNQEWTPDHRVHVEGALDRHFGDPSFRDMWVHKAPKIAPPWPTYDATHHNQVAVIAQATGMVTEALTYETRGREPRPSVVEKLQELLSGPGEVDAVPAVEHEQDELYAA